MLLCQLPDFGLEGVVLRAHLLVLDIDLGFEDYCGASVLVLGVLRLCINRYLPGFKL